LRERFCCEKMRLLISFALSSDICSWNGIDKKLEPRCIVFSVRYGLNLYMLCRTQKTNSTSRQRGQTLAGLCWRGPAATVNYRPALSSEMALQSNKPHLSKRKFQGERKIGRVSQMGAWHQDGLADWLSVVMWLWLRLWLVGRLCGQVVRVPGYRTEMYCVARYKLN
jgi:hypothetical protein